MTMYLIIAGVAFIGGILAGTKGATYLSALFTKAAAKV